MVLKTLGLATDGNRFDMSQRLMDHLDVKKTADMVSGAASAEDLRQQVDSMSLRELRSQLVSRGLASSGARTELEQRLYEVLFNELPVRRGQSRGGGHRMVKFPPQTIPRPPLQANSFWLPPNALVSQGLLIYP